MCTNSPWSVLRRESCHLWSLQKRQCLHCPKWHSRRLETKLLQSDDTKPKWFGQKKSGKTFDKKKHGSGSSMLCITFREFSSSVFSSSVVLNGWYHISKRCLGNVIIIKYAYGRTFKKVFFAHQGDRHQFNVIIAFHRWYVLLLGKSNYFPTHKATQFMPGACLWVWLRLCHLKKRRLKKKLKNSKESFKTVNTKLLTASGLGCAAEDENSTVSSGPSASLSSLEIRPWMSGEGARWLPSSCRCFSSSWELSDAVVDRL